MSDPEGFLTRWNRRKQAAKRDAGPDAAAETAVPESGDPARTVDAAKESVTALPAARGDANDSSVASRTARDDAVGETFDPASLPPIESITAQSDIGAFLKPGVPAELSRAALRRAWSADPAIRDFVGIAENQWDFTAPNEIMGFGPLDSAEDIARMVEKVFGEVRPQDGPMPDDQNLSAQNVGTKIADAEAPNQMAPAAKEDDAEAKSIVHRNENNTAPQYSEQSSDDLEPAQRRGHGRALPQ